jgi:hypothetical protein
MTITRIIAAATIASALAFAPSAFAEGSPAPQAKHGGMMHDGARPDTDCGCHRARTEGDEARASKHEPVANGDRGQGDGATAAGSSWSSRNR